MAATDNRTQCGSDTKTYKLCCSRRATQKCINKGGSAITAEHSQRCLYGNIPHRTEMGM